MIGFYFSKLIRKICGLPTIAHSKIDKTSRIGNFSSITNCTVGRYSYTGEYTVLSYVDCGDFVSISRNCVIGGGEHPTDWVSTSPVFNEHKSILRKQFSRNSYNPYKKTKIGNDVWIGACCSIKSGVNISDGAVIGMGSVVTKDVGPYEIWAGNPARFLKKRFDDNTIGQLMSTEWWKMPEDEIIRHSDDFNDVQKFLEGIQ